MRWKRVSCKDIQKWHKWFAWFPIDGEDGYIYWLCYVNRRLLHLDYLYCYWEYSLKGKED